MLQDSVLPFKPLIFLMQGTALFGGYEIVGSLFLAYNLDCGGSRHKAATARSQAARVQIVI
jgi:hypothetical protein